MSVYCHWVRKQIYVLLLSQCGSTADCLNRSVDDCISLGHKATKKEVVNQYGGSPNQNGVSQA